MYINNQNLKSFLSIYLCLTITLLPLPFDDVNDILLQTHLGNSHQNLPIQWKHVLLFVFIETSTLEHPAVSDTRSDNGFDALILIDQQSCSNDVIFLVILIKVIFFSRILDCETNTVPPSIWFGWRNYNQLPTKWVLLVCTYHSIMTMITKQKW